LVSSVIGEFWDSILVLQLLPLPYLPVLTAHAVDHSKADSRSPGQEISCCYGNHIHKSPLFDRIPSQFNIVHNPTLCFSKIYLNIILTSTPEFQTVSPFRFCDQTTYFSSLPCVLQVLLISSTQI
jgi:hypothetical protein